MLNKKIGSLSVSSVASLGVAGILALAVSGCGKSVTVKDRGSVSPTKTVPGPTPSSKPSASPKDPAGGQESSKPTVAESQSGNGSLEMPSKTGTTVGSSSFRHLILTDKPQLGNSLAADCDKQRFAAQEKFLRSSGLAAELLKTIDPVILKFSDSQMESLRTATSKDELNSILRQGYALAGHRVVGADFAAVNSAADDSVQTYLGIWRQGPVLASVKRQRTLGKFLQVTKLNWTPTKESYLVSVQVSQVRPGKKLTVKGIPNQDLFLVQREGGSLLVYLDLTQVSRDCMGLTAMTVEEQLKFSTLPVARFTK